MSHFSHWSTAIVARALALVVWIAAGLSLAQAQPEPKIASAVSVPAMSATVGYPLPSSVLDTAWRSGDGKECQTPRSTILRRVDTNSDITCPKLVRFLVSAPFEDVAKLLQPLERQMRWERGARLLAYDFWDQWLLAVNPEVRERYHASSVEALKKFQQQFGAITEVELKESLLRKRADLRSDPDRRIEMAPFNTKAPFLSGRMGDEHFIDIGDYQALFGRPVTLVTVRSEQVYNGKSGSGCWLKMPWPLSMLPCEGTVERTAKFVDYARFMRMKAALTTLGQPMSVASEDSDWAQLVAEAQLADKQVARSRLQIFSIPMQASIMGTRILYPDEVKCPAGYARMGTGFARPHFMTILRDESFLLAGENWGDCAHGVNSVQHLTLHDNQTAMARVETLVRRDGIDTPQIKLMQQDTDGLLWMVSRLKGQNDVSTSRDMRQWRNHTLPSDVKLETDSDTWWFLQPGKGLGMIHQLESQLDDRHQLMPQRIIYRFQAPSSSSVSGHGTLSLVSKKEFSVYLRRFIAQQDIGLDPSYVRVSDSELPWLKDRAIFQVDTDNGKVVHSVQLPYGDGFPVDVRSVQCPLGSTASRWVFCFTKGQPTQGPSLFCLVPLSGFEQDKINCLQTTPAITGGNSFYPIARVARSATGKYVAILDREMGITLWNTQQPNDIVRLSYDKKTRFVNGLAFNWNGTALWAYDQFGLIRWDLPPHWQDKVTKHAMPDDVEIN